ncbi:hypothetical protein SERLADRAFT_432204 [Serpula lacrymans var. lacrymans S7.9]|uniref:Uncharacterized protein n=1 Tax=Serpula lacrymans var. lacrymans (strain S7.9) TaxID=578457 RepID=F8NEJ0_SERL9|nr:uncharacterized protein SERLADRAFT_432204 [Serpula lacrymans var. lacrymans S7.9]EGO30624.1 hypothetical protein SERLADRAFT_432204 [Serpula lacrymans var. lacrymans S7.9]
MHNVRKCNKTTCWDGSPAHCSRGEKGLLQGPTGHIICINWQHPVRFKITNHNWRHECSAPNIMELTNALANRKTKALTPYKPDTWCTILNDTGPHQSTPKTAYIGGYNNLPTKCIAIGITIRNCWHTWQLNP